MNRLLIISIGLLCLVGCAKNGVPAPLEETFLPGECLSSNTLDFTGWQINNYTGPQGITLGFQLNMDCELSSLGSPWASGDYRYVPTENVFNQFKEECPAIKALYEDAWNAVVSSSGGLCFLSSVFYESGIILVADKEFAGVAAGDNIANGAIPTQKWQEEGKPYTTCLLDNLYSADSRPIPVGNDFRYDYCLAKDIAVRIPLNNRTVVDEDVTFTLVMPVKVGLYLTWLKDKTNDPDASFPYRDETLTCTFTIPKGLH